MQVLRNSTGTNLMILQEQYNHQKRLQQIYEKPVRITKAASSQRAKSARSNNRNSLQIENTYIKEQHLKNIKKLLYNITRDKTNQ